MKIHCIGIGGIGVSALARYYIAKGHRITGSDLGESEIIDGLRKFGAEIILGKQQAGNIPEDADLVIYSAAVTEDNPELKRAQEIRVERPTLEVLTYAQALGRLTREYFTIAVSGTHGKSTTVAMLSLVLIEAGLDPTVIVGTKLNEFNDSNFRLGSGKYLIIEADEWQGSFLNYHPDIIVLTNIEEEHLDYYKDLSHIIETYQKYLDCLSPSGTLVFNEDDHNIIRLLSTKIIKKRIPFSINQKESEQIAKVIKIPGQHNIKNALAVLGVEHALEIPDNDLFYRAIGQYHSCWRRFDCRQGKIDNCEFMLIHDYAHHPTELEALFQALENNFKDSKIWFIFQPHQYQRTFYFFDRFVKVFRDLDRTRNEYQAIITDIYDVPGREQASLKNKVNARDLVKAIDRSHVIYWPFNQLDQLLREKVKPRDIVVAAGAGNIYQWAHKLEK